MRKRPAITVYNVYNVYCLHGTAEYLFLLFVSEKSWAVFRFFRLAIFRRFLAVRNFLSSSTPTFGQNRIRGQAHRHGDEKFQHLLVCSKSLYLDVVGLWVVVEAMLCVVYGCYIVTGGIGKKSRLMRFN